MKKMRNWIVGLTLISLIVVGLVAVADNGFGAGTTCEPGQAQTCDCDQAERDADGDGIPNSEDTDWVRPLDGTGYGNRSGGGCHNALRDGSGFRAGARGIQQGTRGGGTCDGSCE